MSGLRVSVTTRLALGIGAACIAAVALVTLARRDPRYDGSAAAALSARSSLRFADVPDDVVLPVVDTGRPLDLNAAIVSVGARTLRVGSTDVMPTPQPPSTFALDEHERIAGLLPVLDFELEVTALADAGPPVVDLYVDASTPCGAVASVIRTILAKPVAAIPFVVRESPTGRLRSLGWSFTARGGPPFTTARPLELVVEHDRFLLRGSATPRCPATLDGAVVDERTVRACGASGVRVNLDVAPDANAGALMRTIAMFDPDAVTWPAFGRRSNAVH